MRCVLRSLLSVHQLVSAADVTKATVPGPTSDEQRRTRTLRPSGPTSPPTTSPAGRLGLNLVVDVVVLAGSGSVAEGAKPACAVQSAACTRRNPGPAANLVRPSISGIPAAHSLSTPTTTICIAPPEPRVTVASDPTRPQARFRNLLYHTVPEETPRHPKGKLPTYWPVYLHSVPLSHQLVLSNLPSKTFIIVFCSHVPCLDSFFSLFQLCLSSVTICY